MLKWKSKWLAAVVATTLLVPGLAYADNTSLPRLQDPGEAVEHSHDGHHHKMRMMHGVHFQTYVTLLSEKYTPDQTQQWKDVFTERNRLYKEMKSVVGEISSKEKQEKYKQWMKTHKEELGKLREERKALCAEFTEAITSQDATRIKAVLPKMLEQAKQKNVRMTDKIAELKKKG